MAADTTAQKKRKWDLDDQGQSHTETANKITKTTDEFSSKSSAANDSSSDKSGGDPGKAALDAAAAKINAILAQKGIKETVNEQREKGDGEFVKNIPINDLKNRYMLTRGATQAQIQRETNADVTTRGKYYPDKALATDTEPPLYLHISATTKESLEKAVVMIEDMIQNATLPAPTPHPAERRERERRFFEEKIYVGLESTPHFNLRAKIVGPQGSFVKHIQSETGTRVQLKGKGSGFYETSTGLEAEEPLHVHITCTREEGLEKAVELTRDLINTVKADYDRAQRQPYGGYYGHHGRGGYNRDYSQNYGYYNHQHPQSSPPPSTGSGSATPSAVDARQSGSPAPAEGGEANATSGANAQTAYAGYDYSQYYQYYGYQYDPNYYNYYGYSSGSTDYQQQQSPSQASPPPPPHHQQSSPPPPPPPSGNDDPYQQSYNAVPPPPPPSSQ
ncbi:eukaryotic type kh-domain type i [Lichtheimia corymbifera JMRC:FSU:9682]|uniref:Eukaryotic type kh-domain type i n=1 Tax=Lichtheimia corymbifera JMRC:FSU:9682 TaxID=1263082 RepID=A0A068SGK1_9FUNG|nr:eukaryotic type kh-domain type i [Lichtheimia corymbifera JMRC:FSU:9682]